MAPGRIRHSLTQTPRRCLATMDGRLIPVGPPFQSSKWDPKFQMKPASKRKDHNERPNSAPRGRIGRADRSRRVGRRPSGAQTANPENTANPEGSAIPENHPGH